jgi:hypothetical protein
MSDHDDADRAGPGDFRAAATKRAQQAYGAARDFVANTDVDDLRSKAADTAQSLYRDGRDLIANNSDLTKAKDDLSDRIRKNPLAAVGIAFTAGLLIALITRG